MSVERIRETIKVHLMAAESCGKREGAFALLELLAAIDRELVAEARS